MRSSSDSKCRSYTALRKFSSSYISTCNWNPTTSAMTSGEAAFYAVARPSLRRGERT